jgi:hypothetical protein
MASTDIPMLISNLPKDVQRLAAGSNHALAVTREKEKREEEEKRRDEMRRCTERETHRPLSLSLFSHLFLFLESGEVWKWGADLHTPVKFRFPSGIHISSTL